MGTIKSLCSWISFQILSVWKMTNIMCSYSRLSQSMNMLLKQVSIFLQYGPIILTFGSFLIYQYFLQLHCFISKRNSQITHKFMLSWNLLHYVLTNQNTTFLSLQFSFLCHFPMLKLCLILVGSSLFLHKIMRNIPMCSVIFHRRLLLKILYFTD